MDVDEWIEHYEKQLEEIDKKMPWKEIALYSIMGREPMFNSWLFRVKTEYMLFIVELRGIKRGLFDDPEHTQTHADALFRLLSMSEDEREKWDRYVEEKGGRV